MKNNITVDFNPLVSIIIPVFNGANFIREAIDSALEQTYKNCEVIVINDGSTDNGETEKIVKSYGNRIRYFSKTNGGVSSALNLGIEKMHGEYFSWLSHDDVYEIDKIENQIEQLRKYSSIEKKHNTVALCEVRSINKDSIPISSIQRKRNLSVDKINTWDESLMDLLINGSFYGCALLIPKNAIINCGMFREDLRYCQDYLMWLKLALAKFNFVYSSKKLVSLRIHSGQLTQTGRSLYHEDIVKLAEEIVPMLSKVSTKNNNFIYYFACNMAKYNNSEVVKYCLDSDISKEFFGLKEYFRIYLLKIYGKMRPEIRKLYYKLVRNIKTS